MRTTYESVDLFGLEVADVDLSTATEIVVELARDGIAHLIVTPNSDHFLRWQEDDHFRAVYSRATIRVIDGAPLAWIGSLRTNRTITRVPGVDVFLSVLEAAEHRGLPIAIIGGSPAVLEAAVNNAVGMHPELDIFLSVSPTHDELQDATYLNALAANLATRQQKVVALCLGSPKQEVVYEALRSMSGPGAYLGVGAAVDFLAGQVPRAPRWIQAAGAEWLFRLAIEPRRLWRRYLVTDIGILRYLLRAAMERAR